MEEEVKEIAIGEEGVIDGVKVRCVDTGDEIVGYVCTQCVLNGKTCSISNPSRQKCDPSERSDGKYVVFQEVK